MRIFREHGLELTQAVDEDRIRLKEYHMPLVIEESVYHPGELETHLKLEKVDYPWLF